MVIAFAKHVCTKSSHWRLKLTGYMSIIPQKRWKKQESWVFPVGEPLKLYSVPLWHLPIILELSLITDTTRWTRSFILSFLSLGAHHLVEKGVQKLGSGDWWHYSIGMLLFPVTWEYMYTITHTNTETHIYKLCISLATYAHWSNTRTLHGNLEFQ